ncbi:hypothetical protein [Methylomonas koyamae]|uniref:hypothetical protein n=1 Tax=Methylomonas koyamae TaxID=702114 RepID=UPI001E4E48F1|nr:hypothetical protein [Methylomonas koyamae]
MLYTTWSPCPICSRAILLYGIPGVVIGDNQTFVGEKQLLRQRGVTLEIAQDQRGVDLIRRPPRKLWNEDIGV